MDVRRCLVAIVATGCVALTPAGSARVARDAPAGVTVIGVIPSAVGPITGAAQDGRFLYVSGYSSMSIYDTFQPTAPELLAVRPSPHMIYGELLSTDGEILLLNAGFIGPTLDVWNVEDKSNPVLAGTVEGLSDEHVSCLLECTWAYGSDGSVIDLRDPTAPDLTDTNWKIEAGIGLRRTHRVDEFRQGFMATAPRSGPPLVMDVRRPLKPRVVASAKVPRIVPNLFLYTEWANGGRDRFMISSTENAGCSSQHQGALVTFDTQGWPDDDSFELLDSYKYRGRTDSDDDSCQAYYFSLHPDFDDGGLALLPNALEGTRIIEIDGEGQIEEVDSFVLPHSNVWLAFWAAEDIIYALNQTGEIYVLGYEE
ncbi:MAG: hypothetical protein M3271_09610 [Actinomycetota bacterium]|nr:hypothetical protein [Actinomycetota bacterium]